MLEVCVSSALSATQLGPLFESRQFKYGFAGINENLEGVHANR